MDCSVYGVSLNLNCVLNLFRLCLSSKVACDFDCNCSQAGLLLRLLPIRVALVGIVAIAFTAARVWYVIQICLNARALALEMADLYLQRVELHPNADGSLVAAGDDNENDNDKINQQPHLFKARAKQREALRQYQRRLRIRRNFANENLALLFAFALPLQCLMLLLPFGIGHGLSIVEFGLAGALASELNKRLNRTRN